MEAEDGCGLVASERDSDGASDRKARETDFWRKDETFASGGNTERALGLEVKREIVIGDQSVLFFFFNN